MTQCTFTLIAPVQFIILYLCCLQVVQFISKGRFPTHLSLVSRLFTLFSACPNLVNNLLCDYGLFFYIYMHSSYVYTLDQNVAYYLNSSLKVSVYFTASGVKKLQVLACFTYLQPRAALKVALLKRVRYGTNYMISVCIELHVEH
jgi:hypothetical protein